MTTNESVANEKPNAECQRGLGRKLSILGVAFLLMGAVWAEGKTWYYMSEDESVNSLGALWQASKWNDQSDGSGNAATAFDAADTYIALKQLVAAGTRTFAGGPLVINKGFWTKDAGSFSFPNGLELADGGVWRNRYGAFNIYGPVSITYTSYPFIFYCDKSAVTTFHGPLIGSSKIRITCGEKSNNEDGSTFVFAGDNSAYLGSANIKPSSNGHLTKAGFASFPGTLSVQANAVLLVGAAGADTVSTYGSLTLVEGSTLELMAEKEGGTLKYPSLAATTGLTVGDSVTIVIPAAAIPSDGLPHVVTVLTAPEGATIDPAKFTLKTSEDAALSSDYLALADGGRTLQISFPAVIESGVTLLTGETPTSGVTTLNSLTLKAGAILKLNGAWSGIGDEQTYSSASLAVESELAVRAPVTVTATRYAVPANGKANTLDILKAPAGVALDADDFVFERTEDGVQIATLGVRQDGGRDILTVTFEPVVEMVVSDTRSSGRATSSTADTAFYAASSWSDNQIPHAGAHYLVRQETESSTPIFFRTPTDNTQLTFPGTSLTLEKNAWLIIFQGGGFTFTVPDLRVREGASVLYGQSSYGKLGGKLTFEGGAVNFGSYGNSITVTADVCGCGEFLASGPKDYGSAAHGNVILAGNNQDFTGTFNVEYCRSDPSVSQKYEALRVSSSDQLGGNLASFDADAIRLAKYGRLAVYGNVTVPAASNRGLTVDGLGGCVDVLEDCTLTLGTQLTLTGPLTKLGDGTLVLGGAAAANDVALTVEAGSLVVSHADALNGVATTLASGMAVTLALDPANADLCRYGIRNVKAATPWSFAGDQLPLVLKVPADARAAFGSNPIRLGIVTVKDAAAATAIEAALPDFSESLKGFVGKKTLVTDSDTGHVTIAYDFTPSGLVLLVR